MPHIYIIADSFSLRPRFKSSYDISNPLQTRYNLAHNLGFKFHGISARGYYNIDPGLARMYSNIIRTYKMHFNTQSVFFVSRILLFSMFYFFIFYILPNRSFLQQEKHESNLYLQSN